jgi:epoxyqueuosine reductase
MARIKHGKRVLVHMCCGPCSISVIRALREEGFEPTGFFYNPNIHPLTEYLARREGVVQTAERLSLPVIFMDGEYDPAVYLRETAFREQNRCFHCYRLRLERLASVARRGGFDFFSSTLLYSKMQKHEVIRDLGVDLAAGGGPAFAYRDFRTGWKEGVETSKAWGIYRQQYCGCIYSEFERYRGELAALKTPAKPDGEAGGGPEYPDGRGKPDPAS